MVLPAAPESSWTCQQAVLGAPESSAFRSSPGRARPCREKHVLQIKKPCAQRCMSACDQHIS
jgi:hypothetical protein